MTSKEFYNKLESIPDEELLEDITELQNSLSTIRQRFSERAPRPFDPDILLLELIRRYKKMKRDIENLY